MVILQWLCVNSIGAEAPRRSVVGRLHRCAHPSKHRAHDFLDITVARLCAIFDHEAENGGQVIARFLSFRLLTSRIHLRLLNIKQLFIQLHY